MKSYRDYLDEKGVPPGPWVVDGPRFVPVDREPAREARKVAHLRAVA